MSFEHTWVGWNSRAQPVRCWFFLLAPGGGITPPKVGIAHRESAPVACTSFQHIQGAGWLISRRWFDSYAWFVCTRACAPSSPQRQGGLPHNGPVRLAQTLGAGGRLVRAAIPSHACSLATINLRTGTGTRVFVHAALPCSWALGHALFACGEDGEGPFVQSWAPIDVCRS